MPDEISHNRYYAMILSVRPALQRAVASIDEDGRGRLADRRAPMEVDPLA